MHICNNNVIQVIKREVAKCTNRPNNQSQLFSNQRNNVTQFLCSQSN